MLFEVEIDNMSFIENRDWDPVYLYEIFKDDFFEFENMSPSDKISDMDLVQAVEKAEKEIYSL